LNVGKLMKIKLTIISTLLYAAIVIFVSCFHEVWRDEVSAVSMAVSSTSALDLFRVIHPFGHPGLWDLILYLAYQIYPHYVVLKISNLVIAIAAVYLFFRTAPWKWLYKILFIGGIFPLYIYPVVNRNYAISMLLIFLFCWLYRQRFQKFIWLSLTLFLLANTHAYSLLLVGILTSGLLIEAFFNPTLTATSTFEPVSSTRPY
jgi:hypothetical protein